MQNQNRVLYIRATILLIAAVLALLAFFISHLDDEDINNEGAITSVIIGGSQYDVLIADTYLLRQKGLSGRPSLKADEGMLFIFDESDVRGFWMKDMLFPLDIIWIDENRKVVGFSENLQPESYPQSFSSIVPVQYVLEINANTVRERGIIIGEEVDFIRN